MSKIVLKKRNHKLVPVDLQVVRWSKARKRREERLQSMTDRLLEKHRETFQDLADDEASEKKVRT